MNPPIVRLQITEAVYFSAGDEDAFFKWLGSLPCVVGLQGQLRTLNVDIDASRVDEMCLRELLALFHRYGIALKALAVFDCEEFAPWFRLPHAYWYQEVFG